MSINQTKTMTTGARGTRGPLEVAAAGAAQQMVRRPAGPPDLPALIDALNVLAAAPGMYGERRRAEALDLLTTYFRAMQGADSLRRAAGPAAAAAKKPAPSMATVKQQLSALSRRVDRAEAVAAARGSVRTTAAPPRVVRAAPAELATIEAIERATKNTQAGLRKVTAARPLSPSQRAAIAGGFER